MRAVVQRVSQASVTVEGTLIAQIKTGLVVLVGVGHDDDAATAAALARKVHGLRILREEQSVADRPDAAVLLVSQFTLYGDAGRDADRAGRRQQPAMLRSHWSRRLSTRCASSGRRCVPGDSAPT